MSQDLHRQANTVTVLRALTEHGPASVSVLRGRTGLSRPTLDTIIGGLHADGLVSQDDPQPAPGAKGAGRPARSFRINGAAGRVVGVDVGRHKILVLVADLTGAVQAERRVDVPAGIDGPDLLTLVQRTVVEALQPLSITVDRLRGITVGVPGVVDTTGRITRSVVIRQWNGFDIQRALAVWSGVPVAVRNDANLAVLAEAWRGAARLCRDVIYILAGRRTRAAIMIDGAVLTGRHGEAGEIGSVPELFFDTPAVLLGDAEADSARVTAVFAAARDGDQDSLTRVDRFCAELARSVRFLITVLDPELVVIGGGLSEAGDQILARVVDHLDQPQRLTPVVGSRLGDTAVALGGVRDALLMAAANDPLIDAVVRGSP
jgi:predicted NBD/HSP70 family sugar kinase